jgi:Uma2 family endonuclease
MSPIGTEHAELVNRLHEWSTQAVAGKPFRVRVQDPIRISHTESEPEPDIVWVVAKNYSSRHPEPQDVRLVIEVADSSLQYDRGDKLEVYAEAGIAEYWIVDLLDEQIEVYRQPSGQAYLSKSVYRGSNALRPVALPTVELVPGQLFAS